MRQRHSPPRQSYRHSIPRHAARTQCIGALQILLGKNGLSLRGGKVRPLDTVFHLQENIALLHVLIGLEVDLLHDTVKLHGQIDAIERAGGADGFHARLPHTGLNGYGGNRLRWLLHIGKKILDHLRAEQIEPDQPSDDDHQEYYCQDQALDHSDELQGGFEAHPLLRKGRA
ncbi:Uncharacterised protein [Brucella abortus]|nr:Uncharacterised protein [Brucella abortus]